MGLSAGAGKATEVSRWDALRLGVGVAAPLIASGLVVRRPRVLSLLADLRTDRRMVRLLQRLRERHGDGPLLVRLPDRTVVVPLAAEDAAAVLRESPLPFHPANREKEGALRHFQPHGVPISRGPARAERRKLTEQVLDTPHELHRLAGPMGAAIAQESAALLDVAESRGELVWDDFTAAWWRLVRRIVLGDGAREDHELIAMLHKLRAHANWSYFHPTSPRLLDRSDDRLRAHLDRAEPGSLAGMLAGARPGPGAAGAAAGGQVPHWLLAFDSAGMAVMRALALLACHPEHMAAVRAEVETEEDEPRPLRLLRAAVLESVRLWPTTPAVLRDTATETEIGGVRLPKGTTVVVLLPFFHRDRTRLPYADRFEPAIWLDGRAAADPALAPFSGGPAFCPGRNLALFTTSAMLAELVAGADFALLSRPRPEPGRIPSTLDPFHLRFATSGRPARSGKVGRAPERVVSAAKGGDRGAG